MKLFLDGTYRPITDTIGFFECPARIASQELHSWKDRTYSRDGRTLHIKKIEAESLANILGALLPLTSRQTRWLFIETQSTWCTYFDNCWRGTDPTPIAPLAGRLFCRGVRATKIQAGVWPATILEVHSPRSNRYWNTDRSIIAMNDGGQWVFEESGDSFNFECVEKYTATKKQDRFTPEMLTDYLKNLGISAYEESFYYHKGKCTAYLVDIDGPLLPNITEYALNEI